MTYAAAVTACSSLLGVVLELLGAADCLWHSLA